MNWFQQNRLVLDIHVHSLAKRLVFQDSPFQSSKLQLLKGRTLSRDTILNLRLLFFLR
jgi:hypothetical protein